jgi:3-(methylthio)propionyl---CoA ligase
MQGLMMQMPLSISSLIVHAARHYGDVEVVSKRVEGDVHRYTYRDLHARAKRLANALDTLGVASGARIGTLAWNGYRHVETYYGVSGSARVCHTINPRLFPEQIAWIIDDAADQYVFFDATFLGLVEALAPKCPHVKGWVLFADPERMPAASSIPNLLCYETLLAQASPDYDWPDFDENFASSLCYTSGTTGNPKGALYSHRSTVLHAFAAALPDGMGLSARECIVPVVPMFHVNAWGLPYAACLTGCKLVLPGPHLDGKSLYELFEAEGVTMSAGVPTIWLGLLQHVVSQQLKFTSFRRTVIGGSACPPAMIRTFREQFGVEVVHAWGMTELSPLGTLCHLQRKHDALPDVAQQALLAKQGHVLYGVDMRIVGADGEDLPWDGKAFGDLLVRGHWVIGEYFKGRGTEQFSQDAQGRTWFATGDVATIDADAYMQITDRSKDVIKSGGEWISSIDLENLAVSHPAVAEAAVIGARHPKWDERPLLVVVKKPGAELTRDELLQFYEGKVAKWWIPDDVVFVEQLPHTATGKLSKLRLREELQQYVFPAVKDAATAR